MKTGNDLGRDSVPSLVLKLAIPTMVAQFVNVLYSIIDRMYIGHIPEYGDLALAGAGICGPIVTLLSSFGTLVGLGGSIQMSIRMGEKYEKSPADPFQLASSTDAFFRSPHGAVSYDKRTAAPLVRRQ